MFYTNSKTFPYIPLYSLFWGGSLLTGGAVYGAHKNVKNVCFFVPSRFPRPHGAIGQKTNESNPYRLMDRRGYITP